MKKYEYHGMRDAPEYKAWRAIKQRCTNPREKAYKDYGARGIKICDDWHDSFKSFLNEVGLRPSDKYSIERIDNERGYEPGNVTWAIKSVQQHNRRTWSKSGYKGVHQNGTHWSASIARAGIRYHLGTFATPEEAYKIYLRESDTLYG